MVCRGVQIIAIQTNDAVYSCCGKWGLEMFTFSKAGGAAQNKPEALKKSDVTIITLTSLLLSMILRDS